MNPNPGFTFFEDMLLKDSPDPDLVSHYGQQKSKETSAVLRKAMY